LSNWDAFEQRQCVRCQTELNLGQLSCPQCHALVHAAELEALAQHAQICEQKNDFAAAHASWARALTLLPADASQAEWVTNHLRELKAAMDATAAQAHEQKNKWAKRLGPLAPLALILIKGKSLLLVLFKLKFLFSFLSFFGLYAMMLGWRYGLGLAISILIHEMGHYFDIKRRGLPAEMPVFLPGLGAYVRWSALGVSRRQMAQVSLAGPLAGWIAAACCTLLYFQTSDPLWAALARTGAFINVLNLVPVWMLDGAKAVAAMGKVERAALLAATLCAFAWTHEMIFLGVAAGLVWRLFTKDLPEHDDWGTWLYFVALLVALAAVLHAVPAPALGPAASSHG
jgi:Zn-dependent protease